MLLIVDRGTFSMPQFHHARDDERTHDRGRRPRARLENRPAATHSRRGSSPQNKDEKAKKNKKKETNKTKKTRKENERNDTPQINISETKFKQSRSNDNRMISQGHRSPRKLPRAPWPRDCDGRAFACRMTTSNLLIDVAWLYDGTL